MNPDFDPKQLFDIPDPNAPTGALKENSQTLLQALPAPPPLTSADSRRGYALKMACAAIAAVALCVATVMLKGLRELAEMRVRLTTAGVALPLCCALLVYLYLGRASRSRKRIVGASAVAAALAFLSSASLSAAVGDTSLVRMLYCIVMVSAMASVAAVLMIFCARNRFVLEPVRRTTMLGLAAGLVAAAVMRLHCPNDALLHVLVGHGLPIVVVAGVSALFGPRVTRA
jgi:hypothetical protein